MILVWFWFASPQMGVLEIRCGLANHHTSKGYQAFWAACAASATASGVIPKCRYRSL